MVMRDGLVRSRGTTAVERTAEAGAPAAGTLFVGVGSPRKGPAWAVSACDAVLMASSRLAPRSSSWSSSPPPPSSSWSSPSSPPPVGRGERGDSGGVGYVPPAGIEVDDGTVGRAGVGTGGWVESCLGMVRLKLRRWAVSPEHSVTVQRSGYSIDCPRTMPRRPLMGFWSWPWTITSVPAWSRGGIQEASREWTARRWPMVAGFGPRYRSRCNRAFPGLALTLEVAAGRPSGANAPESAA